MTDLAGKSSATAVKKKVAQGESFAPSKEIMDLWKKVHNEMRGEFGEAVFRSWLKPLTLQACYHGTLEVSVPTRFMRDWIQTHYAGRILEMCMEKNPEVKRFEVVVVQNGALADEQEEGETKPLKANENLKGEDPYNLSQIMATSTLPDMQSHWSPMKQHQRARSHRCKFVPC